jgi:DNA-binding PucR family transcriptional regulator
VRYRVKKITELVGLDVLQTRDAEVARCALVIGRTQPL